MVKNWPCPRVSNCRWWAFAQYRRYRGQILISQSAYGDWRHYEWSPDGKAWYCYVPVWSKMHWARRWHQRLVRFPPLLFRGKVEQRSPET